MQAEKGGEKAYVLLRDALAKSGKVGIAKVVIKEREHLAALKPQPNGLMLELMRFPQELLDPSEFKIPAAKNISQAEMSMAQQLIDKMTAHWQPEMFHDEYREALEKLIEQKIDHGEESLPAPRTRRTPAEAIDLVSVLQQSINLNGRPATSNGHGNHNGHRRNVPSRIHSKTRLSKVRRA
jgi:DNA end-binding protein Ku